MNDAAGQEREVAAASSQEHYPGKGGVFLIRGGEQGLC